MSEIEELKRKLDEVIDLVNSVSNYYATEKSGYCGSVKKLKQEVKDIEKGF